MKMINLCKKSLNTVLGISDDTKCLQSKDDGGFWNSLSSLKDGDGDGRCPKTNPRSTLHRSRSLPCLNARTQGLSMIATEVEKPLKVLQSSALRPPPPGPKTPLEFRRCQVECSSGMSHCTEGLGFESSDVMDGMIGTPPRCGYSECESEVARRQRVYLEKRTRRKMMARVRHQSEFPPPLTWLSTNGHPNFFLRPERRNGRIRLSQMHIDHHEVFLANRENGRLTLLLVEQPEETCVYSTVNEALHAKEDGTSEDLKEEEEEEEEDGEFDETVLGDRSDTETQNVIGKLPENILVDRARGETEEVKTQCKEKRDGLEAPYDEDGDHSGLRDGEETISDGGATDNHQLLPSSWRCYDREDRDEFWSHRYVTTS